MPTNSTEHQSADPVSKAANQLTGDDIAARFAYLMMQNRDSLYRYLFSLHPIADEVDDLLQDTAMTLWKKIDDYDQTRDFLPWALRVAYFEVLRWRKHMRKRRFILSEEIVNGLSSSASMQEEWEEARHLALQDCLSQLPSTQRKIIDQRYASKGTLKELAQKLGITTHKIYHTLDDAREALVTCVERKLLNRGFDLNT